jgi:hypothetical protein
LLDVTLVVSHVTGRLYKVNEAEEVQMQLFSESSLIDCGYV